MAANFSRGQDFYSSSDHEDNERAFFDSADWALCKQGASVNQKSAVAIETLRPKLKRTPHQQLPPRRPACTSDGENHVSI
ncbi:hypothetical protein Ddye_020068 [Dipteronia dyeriana]|uniref:Uncharacterized protein n=1 Tax=Dipteronia dyeriana TaxID=168575 RepID=A0AAD9TZX0_9ROSI|nr:hypothetical protein Ddye_020068 [Dipteronia dyeriana]